jgi:hypothetical protein
MPLSDNPNGNLSLRGCLLSFVLLASVAWATFFFFVPWRGNGHRQADWQQECAKLYGAMESFREQYGEYPPNFDDEARVERFVRKAFPEYQPGISTPYPKDLDAARALVFWLSEISVDPADPFSKQKKQPFGFYEFRTSRLQNGRYYPKDCTRPFVYFENGSYATVDYNGLRPYMRTQPDGAVDYCAPETTQIIAPGDDDQLGHGGLLTNISEADRDNLVNFDTRSVGDITYDD